MEISIKDLYDIIDPNIIDIRSNQKYNDNHIPGAININYNLLINNPEKYLKKELVYYIYCQKGITSKKATEILRRKGYNVIGILGGYEAYILNK